MSDWRPIKDAAGNYLAPLNECVVVWVWSEKWRARKHKWLRAPVLAAPGYIDDCGWFFWQACGPHDPEPCDSEPLVNGDGVCELTHWCELYPGLPAPPEAQEKELDG